jgi:hypothetical protein
MKHRFCAAGLLAIMLIAAPTAHGDVKNVWLGLQGAT